MANRRAALCHLIRPGQLRATPPGRDACHGTATRDELTQPVQDRYLAGMRPEAAGAVRPAVAGGVDGQRRWFLATSSCCARCGRSSSPPEAAVKGSPDPVLETDLAGVIAPETAAVLLVHLVDDAVYGEIPDGGPRFCGIPEPMAMEMIANNLFYDRDDVWDLLAQFGTETEPKDPIRNGFGHLPRATFST
jgi:hypothetical protein